MFKSATNISEGLLEGPLATKAKGLKMTGRGRSGDGASAHSSGRRGGRGGRGGQHGGRGRGDGYAAHSASPRLVILPVYINH